MDDSRKLGDSSPTTDPCQNGERSGENPGATAVFGTMPDPNTDSDPRLVAKVAQEGAAGEFGELREGAPQAPTHAGREGLQEPIVYKVVLGGGAAIPPVDLLEMVRTNSPATQHTVAPTLAEPQSRPRTAAFQATPAPAAGYARGQSSEGFTQLLRALSRDSPTAFPAGPPEVAERTVASPDSGLGRGNAGFTELLREPNTDYVDKTPEARENSRAAWPSASPSDGADGFTALLQGVSGSALNSGARQPNLQSLSDGPEGAGTFTQLFKSLTPELAEGNQRLPNTAATYPQRNPVSWPSVGEGSFTQLISTIEEERYKPAPPGDDRSSVAEDFSQMPSPVREDSFGTNPRSMGMDRPPETIPPRESSSGSGGLTQIISILHESAKGSEIPAAYPSDEAPLPAPGVGLFTQTYKRLEELGKPFPAEPPRTYSPPTGPSPAQPLGSPYTGLFPGRRPVVPVAPDLPDGPGEMTRILDASKMREMLRGGIPAPVPVSPAAAVPPLAAPSPAAPVSAPWQQPTPLPLTPMPAAVPLPAPAVAPAMGKMQQYLPLLLIIIIFLLVVILVTVVFLLKR